MAATCHRTYFARPAISITAALAPVATTCISSMLYGE